MTTSSSARPRCRWYHGPTVLDALTSWLPARTEDHDAVPFRLPVQYIVRADNFRGYAGTVVAGSVHPGDKVVVNAKGATTTVERVLVGGKDVERGHLRRRGRAHAGDRDGRDPRRPDRRAGRRPRGGPVPATGGRVRGRPGLDRRGGAAPRPVLPAAGRLARRARRGDGDPQPARRRLRRGDGRPDPEDERHRPGRDLHRHPGAARPLPAQPGHRRLPAGRAGQPRHRGGRPGAARAAPRAQRRAALLHRRPRGTGDAEEPAPARALADRPPGRRQVHHRRRPRGHPARHGPAHLRAGRRRGAHRPEQGPRLHPRGPGRERPPGGRDRQADGRRRVSS